MLDLLLAMWPLAVPVPVAALVGEVAIRRSGKRALVFSVLAVFVVSVVFGTVIGVRDRQPVMSQVAAACALYAAPLLAVALVLEFGVRKQWSPIVAVAAAFLVGGACLVPMVGLAMIAQGAFGGDTL